MLRQADVQILRRTQSSALALAQKVATRSLLTTSEQLPSVTVADLILPDPQPLTAQLLELGIEQSSATHISTVFLHFANLFKQSSEADFRRRRRILQDRVPPSLSTVYAAIYTRAIKDWSVYLLKDITPRVIRVRRECENRGQTLATTQPTQPTKRPFNQAAIPVLERFFDQNAFPSRLEKYELADASDMDYRQVHVWFQNRRSRFRKEGRTLNKRGSNASPLAALENSVVDTLLSAEKDEEGSGQEELNGTQAMFDIEVPPHAFPSPYPPVCPYDPFPIAQERRSFLTPWMRRPAAKPSLPRSTDDIATVTTLLAKLSIGAEGAAERKSSRRGLKPDSCPERRLPAQPLLGFITLCPLAPLPALLNRSKRQHCRSRSSPRSSTSALSCPHESSASQLCHRFSSSWAEPSMPFGISTPLRHETKRTLPRRIPKHPPRGHIPYDSPPRRASSISSLTSSTSQSGSDSESPLPTPPLRPTTSAQPVPSLTLDPLKNLNPSDVLYDLRSIEDLFAWTSSCVRHRDV